MNPFSMFLPRIVLLSLAFFVLWPWLRNVSFPGMESAARFSGLTREDACRILGVSSMASREEVERAFREQMRLHHPDKGGSAEIASLLNQARDMLKRSV